MDFTVVGSSIQWFLHDTSGIHAALYHRIPKVTVIDAKTVSLIIDSVGPNIGTQVPAGTYPVIGRIGFWEGNSDRSLQVVAQSQTQPPPSTPSFSFYS